MVDMTYTDREVDTLIREHRWYRRTCNMWGAERAINREGECPHCRRRKADLEFADGRRWCWRCAFLDHRKTCEGGTR